MQSFFSIIIQAEIPLHPRPTDVGLQSSERGYAGPVDDWREDAHTGDCWITAGQGQVDPCLSSSPVPVRREDMGIPVGRQAAFLSATSSDLEAEIHELAPFRLAPQPKTKPLKNPPNKCSCGF